MFNKTFSITLNHLKCKCGHDTSKGELDKGSETIF